MEIVILESDKFLPGLILCDVPPPLLGKDFFLSSSIFGPFFLSAGDFLPPNIANKPMSKILQGFAASDIMSKLLDGFVALRYQTAFAASG